MNKKTDNSQANNIDSRLDDIHSKLMKCAIASAASGAALVEKARIIAKRLEKNDIEDRVAAIEKQASDDLDKATMEEMKSLYENQ